MSDFSRRSVLKAARALAVTGAAATAAGTLVPAATAVGAVVPAPSGPFRHGVASGDPLPDGILLWTRVTPTKDAAPGRGKGPAVPVRWEMSTTADFLSVVAHGTVITRAERDYTVKADVRGLQPATNYFYRFTSGKDQSPVGRTRTAPAAGAAVDLMRVGVVSCANLQAGYFSSYRHLAARGDLDLVLHLGDYLYEYAPGEYQARDVVVRPHDPPAEMITLEHYRRRHAQYKEDTDLQALHAAVPFVVTWDDHESTNDAWEGGAENHTEGAEGAWVERRAFAMQAYAEWMPVRYEVGGQLYRRLTFGSLASISMLDLRSYRDEQAPSTTDPAVDDPNRSITGEAQMEWLLDGLSTQEAQWKLVGNPVMITPVLFPPALDITAAGAMEQLMGATTVDGVPYNIDQWDGYTADQSRVLRHLGDNGIKDTVFLTGDIHSGWACDLPADRTTYPSTGASVGTELVCTSVTSDNLDDILRVPPRTASLSVESTFRVSNPYVKYLDFDSHGYSVLEVRPQGVRMDWYVLSERTDPAATSSLSQSFQVLAGTQKVTPV